MARTFSTMLPLGTIAPDFELIDAVTGKQCSLKSLSSEKGTVIIFMCNHCPFVQHILKKLCEIIKIYSAKNIQFIAINANDIKHYPEDAPDKMRELAQSHDFGFPYLFDHSQETAKSYQAACTPDFYLFDQALHCVYRGRFDESTPGNDTPVTGKDLTQALDHLLAGEKIPSDQQPSIGCNIKWKTEPVF